MALNRRQDRRRYVDRGIHRAVVCHFHVVHPLSTCRGLAKPARQSLLRIFKLSLRLRCYVGQALSPATELIDPPKCKKNATSPQCSLRSVRGTSDKGPAYVY